jgi:protein ImuB
MSQANLSRVACLRIPHFPIAVLERNGRLQRGANCVLTQGEGQHARVVAQSLSAHAEGIRVGMLLSRAMALSHDLQIIPVSQVPVVEIEAHLSSELNQLSPRVSIAETGCFWLEPFYSQGGGEHDFAERLLQLLRAEGFHDGRIGIADTVVASFAASMTVESKGWKRIEEGGDATFLGMLPLGILPIGQGLLSALHAVGVHRVQELQRFSSKSMHRRFGTVGLRAWKLAWGKDHRKPITPVQGSERRVTTHLLEPTRDLHTILCVIRRSIDRLIRNMTSELRAVKVLETILVGEDGGEFRLKTQPSYPTLSLPILFELSRVHLGQASMSEIPPHVDIETIVLSVVQEADFSPSQSELWSSSSRPPLAQLRALETLRSTLGKEVLVWPDVSDSQRPESMGRWLVRGEGVSLNAKQSVPSATLKIPSCMKLLDPPSPLAFRGEHFLPSEIFSRELSNSGWIRISQWIGPEILSGHWWESPYSREYFWGISEEQGAIWVFFQRTTSRWLIHGWLD